MTHHTVTLNWGSDGFHPDTAVLPVYTGDTISFQLGAAPPQSKFKITMNDPEFFSPAEAQDSQTNITVLKAAATTYRCELFDAANNLLSSADQGGGGVRPGDASASA
jgi:hypothetical protein